MIFGSNIITPRKHIVHCGGDEFLIRAVYENQELRRLVPHIDEMLGDIMATSKSHEDAEKFGEEIPEWEDADGSEAHKYAEAVRDILIDAGCILTEEDPYEKIRYFTGRADVLKRAFEFCVESAGTAAPVFNVVGVSLFVPRPRGAALFSLN